MTRHLIHRSQCLYVIVIKIARCLSSARGWQSPGLLITESLFFKGDRQRELPKQLGSASPPARFSYIGSDLIKNDFRGNTPVVRGSEENCINGNKFQGATNQRLVPVHLLLCPSCPFDPDELAQFVIELCAGRTYQEVQGCGVKESACYSSWHEGRECQGTQRTG